MSLSQQSLQPGGHAPDSTGSKTIDVIEDNDSLRSALVDVLNSKGFIARGFVGIQNYVSGFSCLQAGIIISDVYLGDGTAFDLMDLLSDKGIRAPVILMTGSNTPNLDQLARQKGACALLRKPFEVENLLDAIYRHE
jgi:FixJ family two-component response regulator